MNSLASIIKKNNLIIIIISVCFIIRLVFVFVNDIKTLPLGDAKGYYTIAENIAAGNGYTKNGLDHTATRAPFLPYLLSLAFVLPGSSLVYAKMIIILLSTLVCYIIYLTGKEVFNKKTGIIASIIWSLYLPAIYYSGFILTEIPGALFLSLSILFLLKHYQFPSYKNKIFIGIFLILLTYSRSIFLLLPIVVCFWLLLISHKSLKQGISDSLWIIILFAMFALPWTLRNFSVFNSFIPVTTRVGFSLLQGNHEISTGIHTYDYGNFNIIIKPKYKNDLLNEAEQDNRYKTAAIKNIRNEPWKFTKRMGIKFFELWKVVSPRTTTRNNLLSTISYGFVLVTAVIGLILSYRKYWEKILLLILVLAYISLIHMVFFALVRYRFPVEPILIILSAYTISKTIRWNFQNTVDSNR